MLHGFDAESASRDSPDGASLHTALHAALDEIIERHLESSCRSADEVRLLDDKDDLRQTVVGAFREAREVLAVLTPSRVDPGLVATLFECASAARSRRISVRALHAAEPSGHAADARFAEHAAAAGIEVRPFSGLPAWLVVFDPPALALPRDSDDPARGALLVRAPGVVAVARWAFEQAWLRAGAPPGALELSEKDRNVLTCLSGGLKDELAARKLQVSVRTYRRHVTSLCERLDASSRFEAGAKAALRGLL